MRRRTGRVTIRTWCGRSAPRLTCGRRSGVSSMTEPVGRWQRWDGEQWADAGASDLHIVAAEVAGRIVAGDASVPDKLKVGATNGGAIGGGGRFTADDLGDRWE